MFHDWVTQAISWMLFFSPKNVFFCFFLGIFDIPVRNKFRLHPGGFSHPKRSSKKTAQVKLAWFLGAHTWDVVSWLMPALKVGERAGSNEDIFTSGIFFFVSRFWLEICKNTNQCWPVVSIWCDLICVLLIFASHWTLGWKLAMVVVSVACDINSWACRLIQVNCTIETQAIHRVWMFWLVLLTACPTQTK